jgi:hypothetical protein
MTSPPVRTPQRAAARSSRADAAAPALAVRHHCHRSPPLPLLSIRTICSLSEQSEHISCLVDPSRSKLGNTIRSRPDRSSARPGRFQLPGGRQTTSPDHHAKCCSGRQTATPRWSKHTTGLLRSVVCASAVVPVAAFGHAVPGWLAALAVLLLSVGGIVVGAVAAVMPQESKDRLSWWREWLRHRERMTCSGDVASRSTGPARSAQVPGDAPQLPSSSEAEKLVPERSKRHLLRSCHWCNRFRPTQNPGGTRRATDCAARSLAAELTRSSDLPAAEG